MILVLFSKWDMNCSQSSVDEGRARLLSFSAKKSYKRVGQSAHSAIKLE